MNWFISAVSSSLGKKIMMALTGLFLCLFLTVHLIGNLQLLKLDGGEAFNTYAKFMSHNPLIQIISKGNFAIILAHAIISIFLTIHNKKARPIGYQVSSGAAASSTWNSRNMGILGTIILVFIAVHLYHFWWAYHYGADSIPTATYTNEFGQNLVFVDLYQKVMFSFKEVWIVVFYVFSMIAMGYHLNHGFTSAFQTLGLNHVKYNGLIYAGGVLFSILIPAAYAAIPLIIFFR
jgi:succinate dehydrogenase / fumarate reductase, cytochrome b subunit